MSSDKCYVTTYLMMTYLIKIYLTFYLSFNKKKYALSLFPPLLTISKLPIINKKWFYAIVSTKKNKNFLTDREDLMGIKKAPVLQAGAYVFI
jgi:hypothetical protein